jgi:phosphoenolpyruvate synthase/pyruvate phosphate dikinase
MTIIPFSSSNADLQNAGGKGANLARLSQAGFQVPPGFIIATGAYRRFVEANRLAEAIESCLDGLEPENTDGLEQASRQIRATFSAGNLPADIQSKILDAYAK